MLELLTSPEAWAAFLALVTLEIVLGIDNLIFISILSGKLPEHQQARARRIELSRPVGYAVTGVSLLVVGWTWAFRDHGQARLAQAASP